MTSVDTALDARISAGTLANKLLLNRPAVAVTLLASMIYLATLTEDYYWDGLTFALQIEQVAKHADPASELFHQNHLLYNAIGYYLYVTIRAMGFSIRALSVLQVVSALSCAIGVGIFFATAMRVSRSLYIAAVGSGLLLVATCWWKSATDADAYSLSATLVLICATVLLGQNPRWYLAGAALAAAILIHELASLFYPAAIVAVLLSNRIENRLRFALKLSALAWGITIVCYYAVAIFAFGITAPSDVMKWAGSNPYGKSFTNPLWQIPMFPKHQLDLVFGHSLRGFRSYSGAAEFVLAGVGVAVALVAVFIAVWWASFKEGIASLWTVAPDAREHWKRNMPVVVAWAGTYALFLLTWEPFFLHYRVYYVPAVVMIFVLVLNNYHRRRFSSPSGAAALAVVALFFLNLAFFIAPHMHTRSNLLVAAAKSANDKWNEHTVIYFNGSSSIDTAFQYFNERTEWRGASAKRIMKLDGEIEEIYRHGGDVWLNDTAAKSVESEWLAHHARGEELRIKLGPDSYHFVQLLPAR